MNQIVLRGFCREIVDNLLLVLILIKIFFFKIFFNMKHLFVSAFTSQVFEAKEITK